MYMLISYKKNEGKWSKPKNRGDNINAQNAMGPYLNVSPNGKVLFFQSTRIMSFRTYWISAKIIEELLRKK